MVIARRILDKALSYGIRKEDVYIDCLTLTVSAEQEKVNVYFRVMQPELGTRLVARCGDEVIYSKKEFRVNPGEMCHVVLDTAALKGDTVTVEVIKED